MSTSRENAWLPGRLAASSNAEGSATRSSATGSTSASPQANPNASALITTELPVTSAPTRFAGSAGRSFEPDWYRDQPQRLAAPLLVRFFVWLLFLAFILGLIGLAVVYVHPTWVSFLRKTGSPTTPQTSRRILSTQGNTETSFRLESTTGKAATYSVPLPNYTIVVAVDQKSWVEVTSPATAAHPVFAKTLAASAKEESIPVHGSSSIAIGARVAAISIRDKGKSVGKIVNPKVDFTYTFLPATS